MKNRQLTIRLILMNFLQYAAWGAYLTSLGRYLGNVGLGPQIKWFFAMQGIVSIFMPTLMGILADRYLQAQKTLSLCHGLAGLFMLGAGLYCQSAGAAISFTPLFVLYSISVAFYMPTIAISNSVAYNALGKAGMDPVKDFPPIRVFGTVGFICSMLLTNFLHIKGVALQDSFTQLISSGIISLVLCAYALTMPACEINRGHYQDRVHIGLDFFDGSINRIACWAIGARSMEKAILWAALEPVAMLQKFEAEGDYTSRLAYLEELKTLPFGLVWNAYCEMQGVPAGDSWIPMMKKYEADVLSKR